MVCVVDYTYPLYTHTYIYIIYTTNQPTKHTYNITYTTNRPNTYNNMHNHTAVGYASGVATQVVDDAAIAPIRATAAPPVTSRLRAREAGFYCWIFT